MRLAPPAAQRGFLLVTVVLILGVLAAMALLLSMHASLDSALSTKHVESTTLDYLAESGVQHAKWHLAQNTGCSVYTDLPDTPFAGGTYGASINPKSGSPVTIAATAGLADGTTRTLTLDGIKVYDRAAPSVAVLVPGAEGKDAWIEGESGHTNHNKDDNELRTSSQIGNEYRTLLQFDLTALPSGAVVHTATLELYLQSFGSSDVVEAHVLLRDWTENGVTWNAYDGVSAWDTPGGDYDPASAGSFLADGTGPKAMDITDVVANWASGAQPNYGLMLLSPPSAGGSANKYHSSDKSNEPHPKLTLTYICECGRECPGIAIGDTIILSTDNAGILGGLNYDYVDLIEYNPPIDNGTLFLDGALTSLNKSINAVHVLQNGHIVMSVADDTTIGGLSFKNEDLVVYDPMADSATMYFDGSLHFAQDENIVSVHILNNGNLILSTDGGATLGGVSFSGKDLIEYNPVSMSASIFFDGDATTLSEDITAVHVLENSHIVLAAKGATSLGGLSFSAADLIEYDAATDTATFFFQGSSLFSNPSESIAAAHVYGDDGPVVGAFLDQFNAVAYNGNDGTLDWAGDWQEIGEFDGPSSGDVRVPTAGQVVSGPYLAIGLDGTGVGASREADLSGAISATLSFWYEQDVGFGPGAVMLEVYDGASWNLVHTYTVDTDFYIGAAAVFQSFDISAYAASDTQIRFTVSDASAGGNFFLDDILIDMSVGGGSSGGGNGGGGGPGQCDGNFRDEFNAPDYNGTDGSLDWAGSWEEVNESDGPRRGDEQVAPDPIASPSPPSNQLRVRDNDGGGEGVRRALDLSGAGTATLSLMYKRYSLESSSDYVAVQMSTTGVSGPWTEVTRFQGPANDVGYQNFSQDVSSFISPNAAIRFLGSATLGGFDDVWFDDVDIQCAP